MRRSICICMFCIAGILASSVWINAQENSKDTDRSKKIGLGLGNYGGPSLRLWLNDKLGLEVNPYVSINNGKGNIYDKIYRGTLYINSVILLMKKGGLRFEGLAGLGYDDLKNKRYNNAIYSSSTHTYSSSSIQDQWNVSALLGVGVEYSFQELPDLSFGAFTTGVGFLHTETTINNKSFEDGVLSNSSKTNQTQNELSLSPRTGFRIIYYF